MSDYIRREDAIIQLSHNKSRGDDEWMLAVESDMGVIKAIPAADVVPVVRCEDCVYYGSRRWCELHSSVFDDNAFCSYGERKENGNEAD